MSVVTKAIGLVKKAKHRFADEIKKYTPVYMSPVRRIEKVALSERVCAMTFDDGPCRLSANPKKSDEPLTLVLAKTLEKYGAKGTFDVIGDTSANYPDKPGKEGTAFWGGTQFDHYPDFEKDMDGGVANCPELVERLIEGGHEITNHTYSHVLFGPKALIYKKRKTLSGISECIEDLDRLHILMRDKFGYNMRLSRPPHYVDKTRDGFSSYDAYAALGYQYMAASFDGAGWLPGPCYESEVAAMVNPIKRALEADPDYFSGQIIFQKDGFNMLRRSPVADGLDEQLRLLCENGYKVVTVSELLERSPFLDLGPNDRYFASAKKLLEKGFCVCYRDNSVRVDAPMTRGELAMFVYGCTAAKDRIDLAKSGNRVALDVGARHPYAAAILKALCDETMSLCGLKFRPDRALSANELREFCRAYFAEDVEVEDGVLTHGKVIEILAGLCK